METGLFPVLKKPINGICYEGFIIFYFNFIKGKVKTK